MRTAQSGRPGGIRSVTGTMVYIHRMTGTTPVTLRVKPARIMSLGLLCPVPYVMVLAAAAPRTS
ncbi:MAG TPA: hypothetical protein HA264_04765 [Methanolinea sp.]|nr:hypothetical protein [Methanolinea sp.]HNQ29083.1 hypothetical protein [Methanolinea sp.]